MIEKEVDKSAGNRYISTIRNLKFTTKSFDHHNTDLDRFSKNQDDQIIQLQRFLCQAQEEEQILKGKPKFPLHDSLRNVLEKRKSIMMIFDPMNDDIDTKPPVSPRKSTLASLKLSKNQLGMTYFDQRLRLCKEPPIIELNTSTTNANDSKYTLKDITKNNANIRKIFTDIDPSFQTKKRSLSHSQISYIKSPKNYNKTTADTTMNVNGKQVLNFSGAILSNDITMLGNQPIRSLDQTLLSPIIHFKIKPQEANGSKTSICIDQSLHKPEIKSLYDRASEIKNEKIEALSPFPQVTSEEDSLSILYKFKEMHQYIVSNSKRRLQSIGESASYSKLILPEEIEYVNMYNLNNQTVGRNMEKNKPVLQTQSNTPDGTPRASELQPKITKKSLFHPGSKSLSQSQSQFLLPKSQPSTSDLLQSLILASKQQSDQSKAVGACQRVFGVRQAVQFKEFEKIFPKKEGLYKDSIKEKTSEEILESYKGIHQHIRKESDLQQKDRLKRRDQQIAGEEKRVADYIQGKVKLFDHLSVVDEVSPTNKYFKWQMKKIEQNPLYKIDYKRELAIMDAKRIKELAKRDNEEINLLEKQKIREKQDMFLTRQNLKRKGGK